MKNGLYSKTKSVCPECLKTIDAEIQIKEVTAYLVKSCEVHGSFETVIWRGEPSLEKWSSLTDKGKLQPLGGLNGNGDLEEKSVQEAEHCPHGCGTCQGHQQQTCCVLLEITQACNLRCPVCFASAGEAETAEPSLKEIKGWYEMLMAKGGPFNIQLSGGEPTLREDLPEIIRMGKDLGFEFIQINTNGIKLGESLAYAQSLKGAGLDCAFLQFDGLREDTYKQIRGRSLLHQKLQAIMNCKTSGIGVVLVPTLVPNVNVDEIGDILRFAGACMPWVRGVHFQPISYFGRYPEGGEEKRLTLPEVLREIEGQTGGEMPLGAFIPPSSEHPYCSFNSKFTRDEQGHFVSKSEFGKTSLGCCGDKSEAAKARSFVARQWVAPSPTPPTSSSPTTGSQSPSQITTVMPLVLDTCSLDLFLEKAKYTLAVSGMAFQDSWSLDVERLKYCHIHVVSKKGELIPFCAYNLTSTKGVSLYR